MILIMMVGDTLLFLPFSMIEKEMIMQFTIITPDDLTEGTLKRRLAAREVQCRKFMP
ncbi:hypothetical protein ACI0FM_13685 [Paenochrobactrum sp. BZR 588]